MAFFMTLPVSQRLLRLIYAFLVLAGCCQSSNFKPNCTLPVESVNYVAGSNTRSTLSILWNCFSVIILCTWNILHLNVPPIRCAESFWGNIWLAILASATKLKWMIVTILAPEYIFGKASSERLIAKLARFSSRKDHDRVPGQPNGEWGAVHCYLANMGYLVLDVQHESNHTNRTQIEPTNIPQFISPAQELMNQLPQVEITLGAVNHAYFECYDGEQTLHINLDRVCSPASYHINRDRLKHRYWALNAKQWRSAFDVKIAIQPEIPSVYLDKLDRGGALIKALAIGQVLYLIIQLISRKVQGLPSSQLEIATLAFSVLSLFTYITYWGRPQNIETIHIIPAEESFVRGERIPAKEDFMDFIAKAGPSYTWGGPRINSKFDPKLGPSPIPNDAVNNLVDFSFTADFGILRCNVNTAWDAAIWGFGIVFGGIVFGSLHCLAWNIQFPTKAEAIAWRVCSIATACLPPVTVVPTLMWAKMHSQSPAQSTKTYPEAAVATVILFCLLLYILARLFLLAEMIRCLFFLPPEAFIDTWSNGFPHWG